MVFLINGIVQAQQFLFIGQRILFCIYLAVANGLQSVVQTLLRKLMMDLVQSVENVQIGRIRYPVFISVELDHARNVFRSDGLYRLLKNSVTHVFYKQIGDQQLGPGKSACVIDQIKAKALLAALQIGITLLCLFHVGSIDIHSVDRAILCGIHMFQPVAARYADDYGA